MKRLFTSIVLSLFVLNSNASHFMGGDITWRTDSLHRFIFQMKYYRDCNGVTGPTNPITLITNNAIDSITCDFIQITDISPSGPGCPSCANPMNELNAVQEYLFESAPVILTGTVPATGWYFEYTDCCWNGIVSNLSPQGSGEIILRSIMYADSSGGAITGRDNSPEFLAAPTMAECPGELIEYSHAASDRDLDSLVYEWAHPLQLGNSQGGGPLDYPFAPGYNYFSPLPSPFQNPLNIGPMLDPESGLITFKSYTSGTFVTTIKVSSWKCGIKTAEVYREIPISILTSGHCTISHNPTVLNTSPQLTIKKAGIEIYVDTLLAGNNAIYQVETFDFQLDSLGVPQNIELSAYSPHFGMNYSDSLNGCLVAPCATLSNGSPASGTLALNNTLSITTSCEHASDMNGCLQHSRLYSYTFKAKDNFCPVNGIKFKTLNVVVSGPTIMSNGTDLTVSLPGATMQWYLNGTPIPGATDTIYTPTQSGVYSVIATMASGCELISNAYPRPSSVGIAETNNDFVQHLYVDAQNQLQVIINSPVARQCRFDIISIDGKIVQSFIAEIQPGVQHLSFKLERINEGIYLLQTTSGNSTSAKKFYLQY